MIKYKLKLAFVVFFIQLFTFNLRKVSASNCLLNPCKNGAICHDFDDSFKCICSDNFTGHLCETNLEMKMLIASNCLNMGYKSPDGACICINGYTGSRCQMAPSYDYFKKSSGCLNGGYQPREGLPCKCLDGFYGFMCEFMTNVDQSDMNGCIRSPCRNGGICTPTNYGSYMCTCRNGFYGYTCENLIYRRTYGGFGSLLPFLLFFSLITMCVYCCCFKKSRTFAQHMMNQRQRFNENLEARSARFQQNTVDQTQNRIIFINTTVGANGSGETLPKDNTDLPPSYDDVIKKQPTNVTQQTNPPV